MRDRAVNVDVGVRSDVGLIRTANEDAYLIKHPLFVVADGMGGHLAGDVASSTAIRTIEVHSSEASADDLSTLTRIVRDANREIWQKAQGDASLRGMGTTCTLLLLHDLHGHIAHVGDSRAYRLRAGHLEQLTDDHTLVARLVKEGKLSVEDAQHHPQRSIITRALGVDLDVSVDLVSVELEAGDRLLLCSDGLSSMIDTDSIKDVLSNEAGAQAAADLLVALANDAGGEDNITVLIVDLTDNGAAQAGADDVGEAPAPPEAPEPPARHDTPAELPPEVRVRSSHRGWLRRLLGLGLLVAVVGGSVWAVDYTLDHSWFVGVNGDGLVTIYRGIPETIGGLSFKAPHEVTDVSLADLPEWKRQDVRDEMKFNSLDEARDSVVNLERLGRASTQPQPTPAEGS
jgi:serine/threonine protein phosphatase PrpC